MALQVVEMKEDQGKPYVVVTSDRTPHSLAITELQSAEARNIAIQHAARNGVASARCEMPSAPYPIDATGAVVSDPRTQKIASYRVDVPISTRM